MILLTQDRPYIAQGAAQAVEDAAALGTILSKITSKSDIPFALKVYELSRKRRAELVQSLGMMNRDTLHLPDGKAQIARDLQFKMSQTSKTNPDRWGDPSIQNFLWNWDAEIAAEQTWSSEFYR